MSRVRFGDVAREVRKSCREVSGLRVVGLEHLEPENVTLEQWSESNDNTFSKLFSKGQVLFGRRRAYLKKAALATFDGVCSGDITVIEAIPDALEADLLPFIVQNDAFFDFAVGGSAGSLSPRVKWEHLSQYEFELPTFEEQKKLAQVLWAMERTKRAYKELLKQSSDLAKSQFVEMFGELGSSKFPTLPIGDLFTVGGPKRIHQNEWKQDGVPFFRVSDLVARNRGEHIVPSMYISKPRYLELKEAGAVPNKGDILVTARGTLGECYVVREDDEFYFQDGMISWMSNMDNRLDVSYAVNAMRQESFRRQFVGKEVGSTVAYLSISQLAKLKVIVPPLDLQQRYAAFIEQLDKSLFALKESLSKLTAAQKALMNQAFEK